jgi:hypothetical protein
MSARQKIHMPKKLWQAAAVLAALTLPSIASASQMGLCFVKKAGACKTSTTHREMTVVTGELPTKVTEADAKEYCDRTKPIKLLRTEKGGSNKDTAYILGLFECEDMHRPK